MKTKSGQILMALVMVSVFGVVSSYAQKYPDMWTYKGDSLIESNHLKVGQGLKSKNGKYIAVLQTDGNLCLKEIDNNSNTGVRHIKCTMTHNNPEAILWMGNDGSLRIHKGGKELKTILFDTETNTGDRKTSGKFLKMQDDGRLVLIGWDNRTVVWNFTDTPEPTQ